MTKQKKMLLLLVSLVLALTLSISGTLAYLIDTSGPVQNTFNPSSVPPDVVEEFKGDVKKDVKIQNNGNIDAYIRAMIVVNWVSVDETTGNVTVYGGATPELGTDYTMTLNTTGSNAKWTEKQADGYYYYKGVVGAKGSTNPSDTTENLINKAEVKQSLTVGDVTYQLSIEILAQSIQSEPATAVQDAWKMTYNSTNGWQTYTAPSSN